MDLRPTNDDRSLEEQEDDLLDELENELELGSYREKRIQELQLQSAKLAEMKEREHGKYTEVKQEKDLIKLTTTTPFVVAHFFMPNFRRCEIVDRHLTALASKHFSTKFVKINVENSPFLVEKLKVRVLPCIVSFVNAVTVDRLVGFDELGGLDTFATEVLEKRLQKSGVIDGPTAALAAAASTGRR